MRIAQEAGRAHRIVVGPQLAHAPVGFVGQLGIGRVVEAFAAEDDACAARVDAENGSAAGGRCGR